MKNHILEISLLGGLLSFGFGLRSRCFIQKRTALSAFAVPSAQLEQNIDPAKFWLFCLGPFMFYKMGLVDEQAIIQARLKELERVDKVWQSPAPSGIHIKFERFERPPDSLEEVLTKIPDAPSVTI